ncbi:DNA/RNA non-specific endonuclease [Pseudomonas fontis]|uniref:DNA/RNA non-specific endonuclease n=1 Tax=Pseudomonas fontis TaxID=2942633 RepID=A0ABT5P077_9PSED|nr:DNA/RNA non-specific endonuclease [Pseudomonas fontis]MDD0976375.1 DNA/RNA non-specific endonuclease [Pseudomonas fontis]MDD0993739.1 DNA/RNA non-specific endonuclease [Pseudomonas fontis]
MSGISKEERVSNLLTRLTPEMEAAVQEALNSGRLPESLVSTLSSESLKALKDGAGLESILGDGTLANLEAIIKLVGRPPLLISADRVVMEPLPELPQETKGLILKAEKWIPSVGRIEFRNHRMAWAGTGWVVQHTGKGSLVVTNRHVAKLVATRKPDGTAVFDRSAITGARYGAAIDFREEAESKPDDTSRTAELTKVKYLADDAAADVALLLIEVADFTLPTPMELIDSNVSLAKGELVALIGYPAYDSRNDASAQAKYFRDLYDVKRFAPGLIMQPAASGQLLTYDCTSLGGNSGSPVIRLSDGKVVGLHFQGVYKEANTAISAATISALVNGERPVSVLMQGSHSEAKDGTHKPEWFSKREGFDSQFLKTEKTAKPLATPWPGLPPELAEKLAKPSDAPDEPNELRYTHFGVKYSTEFKLPLITAVNIDGEASVRIKRGTDRWFVDERIPTQFQLGEKNFKDALIDRGHLVRREDPNWGSAQQAEQANFDTFHYVNAAAQHSRLNQGKALWQGLENYILDNARTHGFKACVFTGPILRDAASEEIELVIDGAVAAVEFWKLVVTLNAAGDALHATAYVLSQGQLLRKLLEDRSRRETLEGFELGPYRTFQVAVADLAQATGYDFKDYASSDPLAQIPLGQEALARGEPVFLPIETLDQIIL